ncbi:MAG: DNA methyltransferase, partial [Pyrinomonadaceae bacterium]
MHDHDESNRRRAPRNRTIGITKSEAERYRSKLIFDVPVDSELTNILVCGDAFRILCDLGLASFDLIFADPPYNLSKTFGAAKFKRTSPDEYEDWLDSWLRLCVPLMKSTASVYICGDWRSAAAIQRVGSKYFKLQNRITWEREKGRGAKKNWKNTAE